MKISFISQYFFPEQFSNNSIARHLVSLGCEVKATVCVPNYPAGIFFDGYSNSERRRETWEGIEIERVRTIPRGKSTLSMMGNYLGYVFAASLRVLLSGDRPDVIFVSEPSPVTQILPAVLQRLRTGAPIVCWVQDIWPESATLTLGTDSPLIVKPLGWLSSWLYRKPDLVLIQSPAFRPMLERFGIPPAKICVFPNTAPDGFEPLNPTDAPAQAALVPQSGFRVMFSGNIGESQDFDVIVSAAERLRKCSDLSWVIVGSGRDMTRVKALVEEKGLSDRFFFLGRHPEARMPLFFAHADALIVTLKDLPIFALTVPYKVQCYLACGRPVIAALAGEGRRTIETARAGLVSAPGDPDALATSVKRMMDMNEAKRREYGANARTFFEENYAASQVYDLLEDWLLKIRKKTRCDSKRPVDKREDTR